MSCTLHTVIGMYTILYSSRFLELSFCLVCGCLAEMFVVCKVSKLHRIGGYFTNL